MGKKKKRKDDDEVFDNFILIKTKSFKITFFFSPSLNLRISGVKLFLNVKGNILYINFCICIFWFIIHGVKLNK